MQQFSSITLTKEPLSSGDVLLLEQQEWDAYVGVLTKADMAIGVTSFIYPETTQTFEQHCGGAYDEYDTVFFVYRWDRSLNYILAASTGELGSRIIEDVEYQQTLLCSLKDFVDYDYPSSGMVVDPSWKGKVYNQLGEEIPPPSFMVEETGVRFSTPVYGSLTLRYMVNRHRYTFKNIKNSDVVEDNYYAIIYAVWNGGVKGLEVLSPYGFDSTNGDCGNGSSSFKKAPHTGGGYSVSPKDETIHIAYCTQEKQRRY